MADQYVEVTRQSFGKRLGGSLKGILFGVLLLGLGVWLLFWNEGRAVKRAKALKQGAATVVPLPDATPSPANEGALVHFIGETFAGSKVRDDVFDVSADALKLERVVEMFQWQEESRSEERKKLGGGTETVTTYSYSTGWSRQPIDSSSFKKPGGHQNPPFPFQSQTWVADPIVAGDFVLSSAFISQLTRSEPLTVSEAQRERASRRLGKPLVLDQGALWTGEPSAPAVGDLRVSFKVTPESMVSVVGRQQAGQVVRSDNGISLLSYGVHTADAMFESAKQANKTTTWILRVVGFFVLTLGFSTILRPLSVMADVVPMIGNLVERGVGLVAMVLAALVGLVTIAAGWFFYRPLLAIVLLAAAGGLAVWIGKRLRGRGRERREASSPPPPGPPPPPASPPPPPPPPPAGRPD